MDFRKIASVKITGPAAGGSVTKVSLPARGGGRMASRMQYMLLVRSVSSDQAKLGLILDQGPDGIVFREHSTPIANTQLTGTNAELLVGDVDFAKVLGEFLRATLTCISNDASACWVLVDVYEMRKPF